MHEPTIASTPAKFAFMCSVKMSVTVLNALQSYKTGQMSLKGKKNIQDKIKCDFRLVPAQFHSSLCTLLLDNKNNNENNRLPLGLRLCFGIV